MSVLLRETKLISLDLFNYMEKKPGNFQLKKPKKIMCLFSNIFFICRSFFQMHLLQKCLLLFLNAMLSSREHNLLLKMKIEINKNVCKYKINYLRKIIALKLTKAQRLFFRIASRYPISDRIKSVDILRIFKLEKVRNYHFLCLLQMD